MTVFGYPVVGDFIVRYRREEPRVFKSYEQAVAAQRELSGSMLTYRAIVPQEELDEIAARRAN